MGRAPVQTPAQALAAVRRVRRTLLALLLATAAVVLFSPLIGNVPIRASLVLGVLIHQISGGALLPQPCPGVSASGCTLVTEIVWEGRLPEILLAAIAGGALGVSGGTLQGVFRNPLADPYLLGLSSGGAIGAAVVIVLGVGRADENLTIPLFAFVGCAGVGAAILLVAGSRASSIETLLLTGVAISSFLTAVLSVLLILGPFQTEQLEFWLLGGLGAASWPVDGLAFAPVLVVGVLLASQGRELNLLQLGPEVAQSVGVDARAVRIRLVGLSAVATAVAVSFTGIIGFVGLVAPHIVRRLGSTDYRVLLPGAALLGAVFLVGARDAALLVLPSTVLPLGICTAFAGVPFFLYVLYRGRASAPMGTV